MQRLEVSSAVWPTYGSLGVKWLSKRAFCLRQFTEQLFAHFSTTWRRKPYFRNANFQGVPLIWCRKNNFHHHRCWSSWYNMEWRWRVLVHLEMCTFIALAISVLADKGHDYYVIPREKNPVPIAEKARWAPRHEYKCTEKRESSCH